MLQKIFGAIIDLLIYLIKLPFSGTGKSNYGISSETVTLIEKEWVSINTDLKNHSPAVLKSALIKADKSLDNLLKEITSGNTMGERMISGKNKFSPEVYSAIWSGHKVRNSMVHDSGFEPSYVVLVKAIEDLRKGVRELGVKA